MHNSYDAGDISEEVCNSLDGEGKLNRSVLWGEKNDCSGFAMFQFIFPYY